MERVKLISQVSMRPVTEPQTLPRQRVTERDRPPHEAIGPSGPGGTQERLKRTANATAAYCSASTAHAYLSRSFSGFLTTPFPPTCSSRIITTMELTLACGVISFLSGGAGAYFGAYSAGKDREVLTRRSRETGRSKADFESDKLNRRGQRNSRAV